MIGTTAAIIGGLSAAGAIGGAALKSRAAGKASKAQQDAALQAGKLTQEFGQLGHDEIVGAAQESAKGANAAAAAAVGGVEQATTQGRETLDQVNEEALKRLAPYLEAGELTIGQLKELLGEGGDFNRRFTMEDYQEDPGYAFRMAEGQKALERSASARGRLLGGGTLKSLGRYSQGVASQEYQNAFDRFMGENAARFGRLSTVAGMGQTATGQANQMGQWYGDTSLSNLMQGAGLAGNFRLRGAEGAGGFLTRGTTDAAEMRFRGAEDAANALLGKGRAAAQGDIDQGDAWSEGTAGAVKGAMDMIALNQMLNPNVARRPSANRAYSYDPYTP